MANGAFQMKRYFTSPAGKPPVLSGYTSTFCPCRTRSSKRMTMPPRLPEPDAVDQMTFVSAGSGVAKPLSPPMTPCHSLRAIVPAPPPPPPPPPVRLLLGPRYDGPSCLLPYT